MKKINRDCKKQIWRICSKYLQDAHDRAACKDALRCDKKDNFLHENDQLKPKMITDEQSGVGLLMSKSA